MNLSEKDRRILNHLPPEIGNMKLGDLLGALVDACSYSDKPVQIGTWMGEVPIWRVAFVHEITADESTAKEYEPIKDVIKSTSGLCIPLDGCAYASTSEAPAILDILYDYAIVHGGGRFTWSDTVLAGSYLLGYVDFATPEDNVIME